MSAELLDLDRLLTPIPGDDPCGVSLRWDPVWSRLQQARRTKVDPLSQRPDEPPDWSTVIDETADLLATRSKDLMIAVWLVDALTHTDGFRGFASGLSLLHGMIERFWDEGLHPQIQDDDLEQRLAPMLWLTDETGGGRMPTTLIQIELLPSSGDDLSYSLWEGRRAAPQMQKEDQETFDRRRAEADRKRELFDKAAAAVPVPYLTERLDEIAECLKLVADLDAELGNRCGHQAPSWEPIRAVLTNIETLVNGLLRDRGGVPNSASTESDQDESAANDGQPAGPALSRQAAVRHLQQAAAYFSSAEPHSPVGYLIKRAIRWANLPFEQLLVELLKDGQPLEQVRETLGLASQPASESSEEDSE